MKLYSFLLLFIIAAPVLAQNSNPSEIPLMRKIFHENIDISQKKILSLDGKSDNEFAPSKDEDLNTRLTKAATNDIDDLQKFIEADAALDNNNKIKFLRGLNEVLQGFITDYSRKYIKGALLPDLIKAYKEGISMELKNQSIEPIIYRNPMEIGEILVRSFAYRNNVGTEKAENILFLKKCARYPEQVLAFLEKKPNVPFADSLIAASARRDQEDLYNYAASYSVLAKKIQENKDPLVKVISEMARSKNGRQYFPFIDNLYKGKITYKQIDSVSNDHVLYYRLLVNTEIDYADRIRRRDTPMAMSTIGYKLKKEGEYFINEINGLHDSPDPVRFKILQPLTAQELYYLTVLQEEEIYTSSYTRGVYPMIFKKIKDGRGDSLLMSVKFDHFKKWIKMAANYNTLNDFLKRMDKDNAQFLMKAFVNGLDKIKGKDSLEDAVDVAASFSSISDKEIQKLIQNQIDYNLYQAQQTSNARATNIYGILQTLFLSMDSANKIDVSKILGIQPVYFMRQRDLKDPAGKIIIQQFFYGDKDGQNVYNAFINSYSNSNWKISHTNEWTVVTSTHGAPVAIYSNKPLDENKNLDAQAQAHLSQYMEANNLQPTVVIHRGHSYYVSSTIEQLSPSARVILLGSCGGYQSLNTILKICPEAQIISSKQVGSGSINLPLINGMVGNLRQGKDLDWPLLWKGFSKMFQHNDMFDDYVPPYKNLGAVFITAYKKAQDRDEAE